MTATCEVWTHLFGWELRLVIDGRGLQMSKVVRSPGEDARDDRPVANDHARVGLDLLSARAKSHRILGVHPAPLCPSGDRWAGLRA